MTEQDILHTIEKGEDIDVEFKTSTNELPSNLFDTVCAFMNRNGGTILLGVNDHKQIMGVDFQKAESLCKNFATLSNNPNKIDPVFLLNPSIVEVDGKKIIHVFVPASSQVHKTGGKVYDRSVDGDFHVKSHEQIQQIYQRKIALYSENTIYPYLFESHFAPGIVERVRRIIKINRPDHPWNELTDKDFYRISGLYQQDVNTGKEGFTMAALLLFGREEVIMNTIPHYKTDALVRRVDMDRYDDRITLRCNLVESYDKLLEFVAKHLPDKFYMIGDQRVSLREKLFREVIANLLIHREFINAFPASFIIYSDRVETQNANKPHMYGQLFPETFQPFPKNPHIAQIFTQLGRSEELGTGLRNVYRFSKAYSGSDNIIFLEEDVFKVSVPLIDNVTDNVTEKVGVKVGVKVGEKVGERLTDNQLLIIENMLDNKYITAGLMAEKIKISKRKIEKNISKLKHEGLIRRSGPAKGGHWEVIEKQ